MPSEKLHQLNNRVRPIRQATRLKQGLLGRKVEWRNLCDGIDQLIIVQL